MSDEDRAVVVIERGGLGSFIIGLAAGAGLALLLAPQSGEDSRRVLKNRGRQLRAAAHEALEDLQDTATTGYDRARNTVEDKIETARKTLKETKEVGAAVVHSARDELEKRLADARSARRGAAEDDEDEALEEQVEEEVG